MKGIGAKNGSFITILKDLKLNKFSDIWTINKTHNKFLAHKLKMRFKLLNFARKLFLMLLRKTTPPGKCIFTKMFCLFYITLHYKNNLYLSKIPWHERICEIESRFKIVYFFLTHPVFVTAKTKMADSRFVFIVDGDRFIETKW